MIFKVLVVLFMMLSISAPKPQHMAEERKRLPKEGTIYSFTGCAINYDIKAIWCVAEVRAKPDDSDSA